MFLRGVAIVILCASACSPLAPAATPPQLRHTPGAFVTVSETRFDAGIFRLDYPSTWRVVKLSTAESNYLRVAFVAPDQSVVTLTQVEDADENLIRLENGIALIVGIDASGSPSNSFSTAAERLVNSIRG